MGADEVNCWQAIRKTIVNAVLGPLNTAEHALVDAIMSASGRTWDVQMVLLTLCSASNIIAIAIRNTECGFERNEPDQTAQSRPNA
jgi:hypothetical protein